MMTSSNGNIFRITGHLCGEFAGLRWFPAQRPVTRSFDIFFDLRLNKRLSKLWLGWWFETPSRSLWRHCNVLYCCGYISSVAIHSNDSSNQIFQSFPHWHRDINMGYCFFTQSLPETRWWETINDISWWRHQMEWFSALLAFCKGNSPVTGGFP